MAKIELQEFAQMLFLQGFSQKEIAEKVSVTEQTVSRWQKKGNWKEVKTSLLMSRDNRLAALYQELAEFERMIQSKEDFKVATSKEADARRKLIKDIETLEKKYNIGYLISVGKDYISFLREISEKTASESVKYFDEFINYKISKQKWQD